MLSEDYKNGAAEFAAQLVRLQSYSDHEGAAAQAVTPVSMGIPTIGFGPGEYKLAHMRDERCSVESVKKAAGFYAAMIKEL